MSVIVSDVRKYYAACPGGGIECLLANYVDLCNFTQCELFWGRNCLINMSWSRDVSVGIVTRPGGGRSGV
jgi:hypothetical protein